MKSGGAWFSAPRLLAVARLLRDDAEFRFEQLVDLSPVDYLAFGQAEWNTFESTGTGFSRSVERELPSADEAAPRRFAVAYHLLSVTDNSGFCFGGEVPIILKTREMTEPLVVCGQGPAPKRATLEYSPQGSTGATKGGRHTFEWIGGATK